MQNDERGRGRRPHEGGQQFGGQEGNYGGGRGGPRGPRGQEASGPRWQDDGDHYAPQPQIGNWDQDEPFYERGQGGQPPQYGHGRPNPYGPQYEQGGRYPGTRPLGDRQWLGSRSDDPGQSSYGGFRGEDPSYQRQDLGESWGRGRREAGWEGAGRGRGPHRGYGRDREYGQDYGYSYGRSADYGFGGRGGDYGGGMDRYSNQQSRIDPRGYTRSDERVRENVCERLSRSGLDVADVEVSVEKGQVTLQGTVPDRHTKHAIEDCVDDCAGVKDVENRVKVTSGGMSGMSGAGGSSGAGSTGSSSGMGGSSGTGGKGASTQR